MEEKKISIIIPVYGVEKYIKQCLESVINQSYKNLEIIIINDGTEDDSMKIVEKYLSDKRIKVINKENGGLSSARNIGMINSTGEYIYFLDSDDWIENNTIKKLVENVKDTDIVGANFFYYDEVIKKRKSEKDVLKNIPITKDEYLLTKNVETMVWNKLYKISFLKEKKVNFIEGIIHEDEEFTFKCYMNSPKVKYIEDYTYNYRVNRENSIMYDSKTKEKNDYSIRSLEVIIKSLNNLSKEQFGEFIKLRFYLKERALKNLILKKMRKNISKEEVYKFEKKLYSFKFENFNEIEKNILKNEIRNIILTKNFSIFKKFYWQNKIINLKILRKKISRKIKGK